MNRKIALLFAGQGAQEVGMGRDLAEEFPVAHQLFADADGILGRSLTSVMWHGPTEELTRTSNCQPALFVHGLACLAVLREFAGDFAVEAAAGLSLGELTAHGAAGTYDFAAGLRLVQKRGQLMDEACASTAGAMAAMIGGDEAAVRRLAAECDVDVANVNAPGQIVLSGDRDRIERAIAAAKEFGIRRATLLKVAGAYHSRLMRSASEQLGEALAHAEMQTPKFPVISNVTGAAVGAAEEVRRTLQEQVTGTVRWTECMETLLAQGCELFLELGPGGVLAGLMGRISKDAEVIRVSDASSLSGAVEKIRAAA